MMVGIDEATKMEDGKWKIGNRQAINMLDIILHD